MWEAYAISYVVVVEVFAVVVVVMVVVVFVVVVGRWLVTHFFSSPPPLSFPSPSSVNGKPPTVADQRVKSVSVAALGSRQGNAKVAKETQKTSMKTKKTTTTKKKSDDPLDGPAVGSKSVKRKQADGPEVDGEENQPPSKRAPPKAPSAAPPGGKKGPKAPSKKLITGQGKLTSFFRL